MTLFSIFTKINTIIIVDRDTYNNMFMILYKRLYLSSYLQDAVYKIKIFFNEIIGSYYAYIYILHIGRYNF